MISYLRKRTQKPARRFGTEGPMQRVKMGPAGQKALFTLEKTSPKRNKALIILALFGALPVLIYFLTNVDTGLTEEDISTLHKFMEEAGLPDKPVNRTFASEFAYIEAAIQATTRRLNGNDGIPLFRSGNPRIPIRRGAGCATTVPGSWKNG